MDTTKLLETLNQLEANQYELDKTVAKLNSDKEELKHSVEEDTQPQLSHHAQRHYEYILPLVRDIYLLELKVKEQKKLHDERKWKKEAAALGQHLLKASLREDQCVLKRLTTDLSKVSVENTEVTNTSYTMEHCNNCLRERLSFTVLRQGVHVSLDIHTEVTCHRIHFLRPSSIRFGFSSDTFIPNLEAKVKSCVSECGPVSDVVSLVSNFIEEEMAPYVIIVPAKKKAKQKKKKAPQNDG